MAFAELASRGPWGAHARPPRGLEHAVLQVERQRLRHDFRPANSRRKSPTLLHPRGARVGRRIVTKAIYSSAATLQPTLRVAPATGAGHSVRGRGWGIYNNGTLTRSAARSRQLSAGGHGTPFPDCSLRWKPSATASWRGYPQRSRRSLRFQLHFSNTERGEGMGRWPFRRNGGFGFHGAGQFSTPAHDGHRRDRRLNSRLSASRHRSSPPIGGTRANSGVCNFSAPPSSWQHPLRRNPPLHV